MKNKINVLSLFDGMSCGRIALQEAGVNVNRYYSSEINTYAIKVADTNYPQDTENRLGNVLDLKDDEIIGLGIDLLIGGSPCQGFSFSGKRKGASTSCKIEILNLCQYLELKKQGFEFDGQSYLFWEYVRIKEIIKPKYFFLENVIMEKKWKKTFDSALGVDGILIDSSVVSAQIRKRFYWSNIIVDELKDNGVPLQNVIENNVDEKYYINKPEKLLKSNNVDSSTRCCILTPNGKIHKNKATTLLATYYKRNGNENFGTDPFYIDDIGRVRKLTPTECERLQNVPNGYTSCVSNTRRYEMLGNGWTVGVPTHYFKSLVNTEPLNRCQRNMVQGRLF